jgi:hypothetical protein
MGRKVSPKPIANMIIMRSIFHGQRCDIVIDQMDCVRRINGASGPNIAFWPLRGECRKVNITASTCGETAKAGQKSKFLELLRICMV